MTKPPERRRGARLVKAGEDGSYLTLSRMVSSASLKTPPSKSAGEAAERRSSPKLVNTRAACTGSLQRAKWEAPKFVAMLAAGDLAYWIGDENVRGAANDRVRGPYGAGHGGRDDARVRIRTQPHGL